MANSTCSTVAADQDHQNSQINVNINIISDLMQSMTMPTVSITQNHQTALSSVSPAAITNSSMQMQLTYPTTQLAIGTKHKVCVSFVEIGGKYFSIQLKELYDDHITMEYKIQDYPFKQLKGIPKIGQPCIAKFSDDNRYYRAKIVKVLTTECNVEYVDYGNVRTVDKADIFEMPVEYMVHPEYAIRFALDGYKDLMIDDNLHDFFKKLVLTDQPILDLIVKSADDSMFIQCCDLFFENKSILQMMKEKKAETSVVKSAKELNDGDDVIIVHIESPWKFYIQHYDEIQSFELMMERLQSYCETAPLAQNFTVGSMCAVFNDDSEKWFRAEVLEESPFWEEIKIQEIDTGRQAVITSTDNNLKELIDDFLHVPKQVNECCLKDFADVITKKVDYTSELHLVSQMTRLSKVNGKTNRQFFVHLYGKNDKKSGYIVNLLDKSIDLSIRMLKLKEDMKSQYDLSLYNDSDWEEV